MTRELLHRGVYRVWVAKVFDAYILAKYIDDVLVDENRRMLRPVYAVMYRAMMVDPARIAFLRAVEWMAWG